MHKYPFDDWRHLVIFVAAVFVANVIVNTLENHLPATIAGPLQVAGKGF